MLRSRERFVILTFLRKFSFTKSGIVSVCKCNVSFLSGHDSVTLDTRILRSCISSPFIHKELGPFVKNRNNPLTSPGEYAAGTKADDEWKGLGCSGQIPMQPGITNHWDEGCLREEILTPFIDRNPEISRLSRILVASMEDIGYGVNYDSAESYTIDDLNGNAFSDCFKTANDGAPFCPEAGSGRFPEDVVATSETYAPTEEEKADVMYGAKDDLMYFHEQLQETSFI